MQHNLFYLNQQLNISADKETIKKEIEKLINKRKVYDMYHKFKVSNPTESVSQTKMSSPKLLKNISKQNIKIKSCPPGKEINPKTGRCVKTKTQKVKKIKLSKAIKTTPKQKVVIKLEPEPVKEQVKELVPEPVKQVSKSCPEGKELNPKTGRCVKTKTQKERKIKKEKVEPMRKTCPEGKELNPKTGRCVKSKTQKVSKEKKEKKEKKVEEAKKEIVCPEGCIKKPE